MCTNCHLSLAESYFSRDVALKSCTCCSQIQGEHVFHALAEFGWWRQVTVEGEAAWQLQAHCSHQRREESRVRREEDLPAEIVPLADLLGRLAVHDGALCSALFEDGAPPLAATSREVWTALQPHAQVEVARREQVQKKRADKKLAQEQERAQEIERQRQERVRLAAESERLAAKRTQDEQLRRVRDEQRAAAMAAFLAQKSAQN